jgi:hypothetical protein
MKKLIYTEGPEIMTCGVAGEFRLGVPKEVPDDLAEILLRKGRLKEFTGTESPTPDAPASERDRRLDPAVLASVASLSGKTKKGKEE